MDIAKGLPLGLLFFLVFEVAYGLLSLPLYWLVVTIFGEVSFSERWMTAVPYLGLRGLQVGICAAVGAYAAAWVCGRFMNVRSASVALGTYVTVALLWNGFGIMRTPDLEILDIVFVLQAAALGFFLGADFLGKEIARNNQRKVKTV